MTAKPRGKKKPAGLYGSEPEPWPEPVDGVELLDALVATFRHYLALPEGAAETLALWVVFTHAIDASAVAPRLALLSPVPRCGKTTLLGLLIRLVRRPLPTSNVTPAVVYRVIARDQPTLLIDEADTFFDARSELKGILNSGHSRDTAFTWRCDGDSHEPKRFDTYTAIAIAKIGKLPAALQDRCLVIWMQRKRPDDKIERFREDRAASELFDLKRKAARWASDNLSPLKTADPDLPRSLNDRAADNWRLLLATADLAGGHWPGAARRDAVLIAGEEQDTSLPVQLLHDIEDIFAARAVDRISSAELRYELEGLEHRPWGTLNDGSPISAHRLSAMLEPFRIRSTVIRTGPKKTPHGYRRNQFEDAWARYPRPETATPQQDSDFNDLEDGQTATQTATNAAESATAPEAVADRAPDVADHVAVSKSENYNDINHVADVAVSRGEDGKGLPASVIDLDALFAAEYSLPLSRKRDRGPRKSGPRAGTKPGRRP